MFQTVIAYGKIIFLEMNKWIFLHGNNFHKQFRKQFVEYAWQSAQGKELLRFCR